jgi:pimeloyl-ACP methyl ester carboxylesterase
MPPGRRTPESIRIPTRQFDLAALDYGNDGAPPMLLAHGMRDLAWSLDSIAQAFCDRYRVVSLDLRGHGDSGRPGYYAINHFVSDLHRTILHLELERPIVVGHSFGGEVASQLAGIFPELPSACVLVEGLGPPPWEGEGSEALHRAMARRTVESLDSIATHGRSLPDLETAMQRLKQTHPKLGPERLRMLAAAGTRPHPEGGICWKWDPMLRTMFGSFSRDQIEERWGWIECPVLVVIGGESGTWWSQGPPGMSTPREKRRAYLPPSELDRRLGLFRDVRCVEIPGAGHMLHFDAPDALNDAIEAFLSAGTARGA